MIFLYSIFHKKIVLANLKKNLQLLTHNLKKKTKHFSIPASLNCEFGGFETIIHNAVRSLSSMIMVFIRRVESIKNHATQ